MCKFGKEGEQDTGIQPTLSVMFPYGFLFDNVFRNLQKTFDNILVCFIGSKKSPQHFIILWGSPGCSENVPIKFPYLYTEIF